MAQKKILYFTVGPTPTGGELTAIATLNALAGAPYSVQVRNGAIPAVYQPNNEPADYAAGTVPAAFNGLPVFNPAAPPNPPTLPLTQAVVSNGVDMVVPVTGVYATKIKATVVNGVITGFVAS